MANRDFFNALINRPRTIRTDYQPIVKRARLGRRTTIKSRDLHTESRSPFQDRTKDNDLFCFVVFFWFVLSTQMLLNRYATLHRLRRTKTHKRRNNMIVWR